MRPVPTQPSVLSLSSTFGTVANVCTEPAHMSRALGNPRLTAARVPCNRLQHPNGEVTRNGAAHLRDDGRRLGGARALRPPARGAVGADLVPARRLGARRPALLRHD